ncbi:hypothetical protein ACIA5A_19435 [Micromonospora sp. NPDC051300]|uniref:hypothetical protein n=1 Tax=Micromonospora sp. NPDC051300 TaxID=3364286 RepID=UPI00379FF7A2
MTTSTRKPFLSAAALLTFLLPTAACTPETDAPPSTAATVPAPPSPAVRKLRMPETLLGLPKSMDRISTGVAKQHLDILKREVAPATSAVGWAYGDNGPDADMVFITGVSGTVTDQRGMVERVLQPYRIKTPEPVDPGELGGTARCGQGRTEDESFLVTCAWADDQTVGIVAFVSSRPQADRTAQFLEVRKAMTETTAQAR